MNSSGERHLLVQVHDAKEGSGLSEVVGPAWSGITKTTGSHDYLIIMINTESQVG